MIVGNDDPPLLIRTGSASAPHVAPLGLLRMERCLTPVKLVAAGQGNSIAVSLAKNVVAATSRGLPRRPINDLRPDLPYADGGRREHTRPHAPSLATRR
jgi:hypothetical protein